jgi:hypothetical protein
MKQTIGKTGKAISVLIAAGLLFFTAAAPSVWAQTREEKKLNTEAATLNKTAGSPAGQKVVAEKLKKEFNVTDAQITALRDQKMGYGEMAIVFSLAKQLGGAGGITQQNIDAIMVKRSGPPVMGWGQIAKSYNLKLGAIVSQVKKVETSSSKEIKHQERTEHKIMKEERSEGLGKPDKMERPAAGQHSGGHTR